MPDVMNAKSRSALMSRIRTEDTRPEMLARKYLWWAGFRYRLHPRKLRGKPDIVLPRWHTVVFIHGCFWHRHTGCSFFKPPKHRRNFWKAKLAGNQQRDGVVQATLSHSGWRVAVVWECALRTSVEKTGRILVAWLRSDKRTIEIEAPHHRVVHHMLVRP